MSIDLIIKSSPSETAIAVVKDKLLTGLHREKSDRGFAVGDVYLAKIRKVAPGLNAAFVDVGHEKDAFLHYYDLGPQFKNSYRFTKAAVSGSLDSSMLEGWKMEPDIAKEGKLTDAVSASQSVLVQIAKEPISTKGPRLSAEITLAGRYMVLVPFIQKISISSRITDEEERKRLKQTIHLFKPQNFGVIVRTQAEHKGTEELEADLKSLLLRWDVLFRNLKNAMPPKKVLGELDRTSAVLRDLVSADFANIHVDDDTVADEVRQYLEVNAPEKKNIVKPYKGKLDIFDHFGVNKQIKAAFGRHVSLPSGAYLIVEKTEAMHVVDVNSGGRKGGLRDHEQNALETNLEAAKEVARLLRLRDMGGIICVDFIDLYEPENRKKLHTTLKEAMEDDKAKHNVLPMSKFGVVEITRQRVRPETEIVTTENCPTCNGTGEVKAPVLIIDALEHALHYLHGEKNMAGLTVVVHPFIHAYLTKGLWSRQRQWWWRWKKSVKVKPEGSSQYLDFSILDSAGNAIPL